MRYVSTRGSAPQAGFSEVALTGLASDGGLYVPAEFPSFTLDELQLMRGKPYYVVACTVLRQFMPDFHRQTLHRIIGGAYNPLNFGSTDIAPVRKLGEGLHLLKLSEGPTLAFKDLALQFLGPLLEHLVGEQGGELNALGATSGDTGSAAEFAFRGRDHMRLFMLSPFGRMSAFQRRQMYTIDDANIINIAVNGPFDDCQAVVKTVNDDATFKHRYSIGAVNSINWARIAAQVVYYIWAYLKVAERVGDPVQFAVPSGNFGNAYAALVARQMGLPIEIIVCTNENDVLYEFFTTGVYRVRRKEDVLVTSSPSMDINAASNLERFIDLYGGRRAKYVRDFYETVKREGEYDVGDTDPGYRFGISTGKASQTEVIDVIRYANRKHDIILDPHTAVAFDVGRKRRDPTMPLVVAETAQAAKFEDTIREALGFVPQVPPAYARLESLPERFIRIDPDPEHVKRIIAAHVA